jgi:membrane AbrB-like protein
MLGSIPGGLTQMAVLCTEIKNTNVAIVTFMQTIRVLIVVFALPFIAVHGLFGSTPADVSTPVTAQISLLDNPYYSSFFVVMAIISAFIAARIKVPTPFMLGPVISTIILVLIGLTPPTMPRFLVIIAQIMVGTFMGKNIKLNSIKDCPEILPYTLISAIGLVAVSLLVGVGLTSVHTFSLVSAFLGTAPGGIAEMGITALAVNADISIVIAYQLFRLLTILLIVPILLKWRLNR